MTVRRNSLVALFAGVATLLGLIALLMFPAGAQATETNGTAVVWGTCPNLKDWHVNEDETDRQPTPTADGLEFKDNQLIHHAVSMDLKDVKPGDYTASVTPKNNGGSAFDDFFSIEVANPSAPVHYGTLRYEATGPHAGTWNIGGTSLYSPVNPTGMELEEFAAGNNRSTNVVSFGVGYPNTPSDGVATVVSSIKFHGTTYPLTCKPEVTTSPTNTSSPTTKPTASHSATVKPSTSSSHPVAGGAGQGSDNGGALAITGSNDWAIGGTAAALLIVGGGVFWMTRKRKVKFSA